MGGPFLLELHHPLIHLDMTIPSLPLFHLFCLTLLAIPCAAQESNSEPSTPNLEKPLFTYNPAMLAKKRYHVKGDQLKTASLFLGDPTIGWENSKSHELVFSENGGFITKENERFFAFRLTSVEGEQYSYAYQRIPGAPESLGEAKKTLATDEKKDYDVLVQLPAFTEAESTALEALPPFTGITKADLLELLDRRETYGKLLESYLAENAPRNLHGFVRGATQNMFHKDLIRMGYNPYADYEGEPFAKFKDDTEVQEHLNQPIPGGSPDKAQ